MVNREKMNIEKLRRQPRLFMRLVGLSVCEFEMLLLEVERVYPQMEEARLNERPEGAVRVRAVGAGRRFSLSVEARLLLTLLYYRLHVTEALLSCLFSIDQSTICRERNTRMRPVLLQVLPVPMQDHLLSAVEEAACGNTKSGSGGSGGSGGKRIGTLKELLEAYPELRDVCVDGTEQEVPKPKDKRAKKQLFSGKSHCHTLKTQLTTSGRLILHLMGNCPGSVADRTLLKASGVFAALSEAASPVKNKVKRGKRPPRRTVRRVRLDRGYSGIEKGYLTLPGVQILAAMKGTSRSHVTLLGKLWNRVMVSRKRIQIEQNIGHLKNWRINSGLYRGQRDTHEHTLCVCAGLHNFRILGQLSWQK